MKKRIKNPAAQALGSLGGKAGTGKAKARTSEQARTAANKRWANAKGPSPSPAGNQQPDLR